MSERLMLKEHTIKVDNMVAALNMIWHHGYESKPADPENTPHVADLSFRVYNDAIVMIVVQYDWEEGIPIPFSQWDSLGRVTHIYRYEWGNDEEESEGCPQRAFRGA